MRSTFNLNKYFKSLWTSYKCEIWCRTQCWFCGWMLFLRVDLQPGLVPTRWIWRGHHSCQFAAGRWNLTRPFSGGRFEVPGFPAKHTPRIRPLNSFPSPIHKNRYRSTFSSSCIQPGSMAWNYSQLEYWVICITMHQLDWFLFPFLNNRTAQRGHQDDDANSGCTSSVL